ncbi:hypothetical protein B0A89_08835 [Paracoccus contaminans]|uniref:Uncharacterized protein n=1 Tax=Paracoccus contaminans TaxID=1945662 RepID=A0A1W6CXX7_9RHOB|nr:hypothetical protein B0A89_08835 [Paracoccus contaminans]
MKYAFALCLFVIFLLGIFFSPRPARAQDGGAAPLEQPAGQWIAVARGVVEPSDGLMRLAAQREGLIEAVLVEEGDHVTAGQELARLNDKAAQVQLDIARAEVGQARTQLDLAKLRAGNAADDRSRLAPLARADALPRRQIDEARRAAAIAAMEVTIAAQSLALAEERLKVQEAEIDARIVRAGGRGDRAPQRAARRRHLDQHRDRDVPVVPRRPARAEGATGRAVRRPRPSRPEGRDHPRA